MLTLWCFTRVSSGTVTNVDRTASYERMVISKIAIDAFSKTHVNRGNRKGRGCSEGARYWGMNSKNAS